MSEYEQPLVSVIMGAYNCDKTICACIESVISQTYQNWEFIICDDCSKDRTLEILLEYEKKDKRIHIIHHTKNLRLAASLNSCLAEANGFFVARMDADDECEPNRFEKQVEFLEKHLEVDVVGCAVTLFDENGVHGVRVPVEIPLGPESWLSTPFAHPTIMMKRSVYEKLNGYTVSEDTMRAEDLDLWFRFYQAGFHGYNLREPLYRYREGLVDYKKRTLKAAIHTAKLRRSWHRELNIPRKYDWLWMKPIISALVPKAIMYYIHTHRK